MTADCFDGHVISSDVCVVGIFHSALPSNSYGTAHCDGGRTECGQTRGRKSVCVYGVREGRREGDEGDILMRYCTAQTSDPRREEIYKSLYTALILY